MMLVTSTIDGRWAVRYDAAYRQILEGLGEPVITLAEYRENTNHRRLLRQLWRCFSAGAAWLPDRLRWLGQQQL
ncbi:MAG: hypothetical protein CM1200mP2_45070 [Planctomycetaceae bacterium]|nr:MAG: hypothetical protein CM1200mP2_45070 [Planctomycetaceae bacterium]